MSVNEVPDIGLRMFILPNGSEFKLTIDDDGNDHQEAPINYRLMEHGYQSNKNDLSEETSKEEEFSEAESLEEGPSEDKEGSNHASELCKALKSDRTTYEYATRDGREWADPQADVQQVQEALHRMSDEQYAVIRGLAHKQTYIALRMMGIMNINSECKAYQQQYNIIVVSIIGGLQWEVLEWCHLTEQDYMNVGEKL
ncbi:uncharacterized protein ARMOST_15269 [Armillaria ostoyae]|uniref:Uncharacterized protein n=1 Tax=Armillaria ostoyae TaxID=47428 RepID=A0A284RSY5_ARMOS|nr:uncharacterized protein ARMOST_15269 [Armillaria ostoyae]